MVLKVLYVFRVLFVFEDTICFWWYYMLIKLIEILLC